MENQQLGDREREGINSCQWPSANKSGCKTGEKIGLEQNKGHITPI